MIGDNQAVFNTANSSYQTALKLSKYLNTAKICKIKSDAGCSGLYYDIKYSTSRKDVFDGSYPTIALTDGSVYKISQHPNCNAVYNEPRTDEEGNIVYDDKTGEPIYDTRYFCATLYIDVNGPKAPNKFGTDAYVFYISNDKVDLAAWAPYGGEQNITDILTNSK